MTTFCQQCATFLQKRSYARISTEAELARTHPKGSTRLKHGRLVFTAIILWLIMVTAVLVISTLDRPIRVTVQSAPAGATVFDDRRFLGVTPVRLQIRPYADRRLRLIRRGFEDAIVHLDWKQFCEPSYLAGLRRVFVGQDAETAVVRLQSLVRARLSVSSEPQGVEIYLDGRRLGATPLSVGDLRAGSHVLRATRVNFFPEERTVELHGGEDNAIHVTLEGQWEALYRARIEARPGDLLNYAELAHNYVLRAQFDSAEEVLRRALEAATRDDAQNHSYLFRECVQIYTHYYDYPRAGADESLRPACREIVETAVEERLEDQRRVQQRLRQMDRYDKEYRR